MPIKYRSRLTGQSITFEQAAEERQLLSDPWMLAKIRHANPRFNARLNKEAFGPWIRDYDRAHTTTVVQSIGYGTPKADGRELLTFVELALGQLPEAHYEKEPYNLKGTLMRHRVWLFEGLSGTEPAKAILDLVRWERDYRAWWLITDSFGTTSLRTGIGISHVALTRASLDLWNRSDSGQQVLYSPSGQIFVMLNLLSPMEVQKPRKRKKTPNGKQRRKNIDRPPRRQKTHSKNRKPPTKRPMVRKSVATKRNRKHSVQNARKNETAHKPKPRKRRLK